MSLWRQLRRGLRAITHRAARDADIADEVQHYLEQATNAHIARGLSFDDASRAARLEMGGVTQVSERIRAYGWENTVESLAADVRYALRRLRSAPGFTAVTVGTLALGIGASTAIFSAVKPILLEPLPYPGADRVTAIWEIGSDGSRIDGTFGMYRALTDGIRSFEAIAVHRPWQPTITGAGQPERLSGQRVSASFFRVLGVSPALGRSFHPAEDRLNGARVVMLSAGLWRRRFGSDRAIVGRNVTLDGDSYVVVGVMPDDFENVVAPSVELWAPLQYDMSQGRAWGHHLRTLGRLRPQVTTTRATRELNVLGRAVLKEQRPATYGDEVRFLATSLQADVTRGVRPALLAILGAVSLVLIIACVNVTNLLLARGVHRRGEVALRSALGAGHGRLVRQLLTESLLMALIGGTAGIGVAMVGVRALVALSPPDLPRLGAIEVDGTVLAFALVITTAVGMAFGLAPALQAARTDPHRALQGGARRTYTRQGATRGVLVVAEVALALVLLIGSGLLLRSLNRLFSIDPGFDSTGLLTMQVQTSGPRFADDSASTRFFARALEAVRRVPGVTDVALTSQMPLSGDADQYGVHFSPSPSGDPGELKGTYRYAVSPGYVETMRIPLRRGRALDDSDRDGAPRVALISESMARRRLAGIDPIGQRLRIGAADSPLYTIVGVVGDVRQQSLALNEPDAVYVTATQWSFADRAMSLVVRTRGDPAALARAIRRAVWSVDKDQAIARVATMDALLAASAAERRFALLVFEAFAIAALALAAAGLYGVLAASVAERGREMGVRAALGASRGMLLGMVVRQGMTLTALGIALGLVSAVIATQAITALLFEVSRLDPVTYFGVIALLAVVSIIACAVPAWRAARVDPATTLRVE